MNMKNIFKLRDDFMRNNYHTKQKELLLDLLKKEKREFTIQELYEKTNHEIGLTTIYRFIDKLVEGEVVCKRIGNKNTVTYQYLEKCDCENHFYLKCDQCGETIHIDCDCMNDLSHHIKDEHQFHVKEKQVMITGTCQKCYKKGEV